MSASSMPLPFLVPNKSSVHDREVLRSSRSRVAPAPTIRRRPTMQQGRALEILGHAIEYLVDSRMFLVNEPHTPAEAGAVQVLSRSSREVFATCAAVVPISQRLKEWITGRMHVRHYSPFGPPPGRMI